MGVRKGVCQGIFSQIIPLDKAGPRKYSPSWRWYYICAHAGPCGGMPPLSRVSVQRASNALTTAVAASAKSLGKGATWYMFQSQGRFIEGYLDSDPAIGFRRVAPLGTAATDVHGHIEGAWKGVESKPTQHRLHRLHRLSHRLHGKKLNALCRTLKWLSCMKHYTILIGVICDLICVICVIWIAFISCFAAPMVHKSRIPDGARPRRGAIFWTRCPIIKFQVGPGCHRPDDRVMPLTS